MQTIRHDVACPSCKTKTKVEVNLYNGELTIIKAKAKPDVALRFALVDHYKKLKEITDDNIPGWEGANRARAMVSAEKILRAFDGLPDPLAISKECMEDTDTASRRGGWPWSIDTVWKRAEAWLLEKQKGGS